VLTYFVQFISENPERDIMTFLLTASAIGQLFKRGATISAAEGKLYPGFARRTESAKQMG
jgi:L-serine deaminase